MCLIEGRTGRWEAVIGMEVHAQVTARSKLFSGAATDFGAAPNSQVSLVDAAMPGMLPVVNEHCLEQAVRTGLGLAAEINPVSVFDRKNYFYPDLPQGYQISQLYSRPIVGRGEVLTSSWDDGTHAWCGSASPGCTWSRTPANRVHDHGSRIMHLCRPQPRRRPLMEIVSEPDIRSGEAGGRLSSRSCARSCAISAPATATCRNGSLRADVNVSVRRPGGALGTRCEIKNLNSIRFVRQAADYEARRQIDTIEGGGDNRPGNPPVRRRTRDDPARCAARRRSTIIAISPIPTCCRWRFLRRGSPEMRADLPELPDAKRARFIAVFGLSAYDADVLVAEHENAAYFEAVAEGRDAQDLPPTG